MEDVYKRQVVNLDDQAVRSYCCSSLCHRLHHPGDTAGMGGVDDNGQVGLPFEHGHRRQVQGVAGGGLKCPDAPLAEDDVGVSAGQDVYKRQCQRNVLFRSAARFWNPPVSRRRPGIETASFHPSCPRACLLYTSSGHRPKNTGATGVLVLTDDDRRILVEPNIGSILPAKSLHRTNDNRFYYIAFFYNAA